MSRRRFFVPEIRREHAELIGSDAEHLVRVLRAQPGQRYEISDNHNAYLAEIETARKSVVVFRILEKLESPPPAVHITLVPALIKFDRFEWLIEKATELGVTEIKPFEATRSERGLAQASAKRLARWERIAVEASRQSRRTHLPVLYSTATFQKALVTEAGIRLRLDENSGIPPILQVLPPDRKAADRIALLLGPEGGWTQEERTQADKVGWRACSLGRTVLRAETAALAALAAIQAAWDY